MNVKTGADLREATTRLHDSRNFAMNKVAAWGTIHDTGKPRLHRRMGNRQGCEGNKGQEKDQKL